MPHLRGQNPPGFVGLLPTASLDPPDSRDLAPPLVLSGFQNTRKTRENRRLVGGAALRRFSLDQQLEGRDVFGPDSRSD